MAKRKKEDSVLGDAAAVPEAEAQIQGEGAVEVAEAARVEDLAKTAYQKIREVLAEEGTFPAWEDLPPATRELYLDAALHCQDGEARTRYEQIVKEVMNG